MSRSIVDDLIEAYDRAREREPAKTPQQLEGQPPRASNGQSAKAVAEAKRIEAAMETGRGTRRTRGRSPAKRQRDKERSIERQKVFQERREELQRLFGHAKLKNGEIISINEATERLRTNEIRPQDIENWFMPEGVRDVLNSLGEVDAMAEYPALGIPKGTVLFDPKIRVPGGHTDPAIKQEFHISGAELRARVAAGKSNGTLKE